LRTRAAGRAAIDRAASDRSLLTAALEGDQGAWRKLVTEYQPQLRDVVRAATSTLSEAQIDDVLGELWLRVVENDMRWLRSCDPARGPSLLSILTFHVSQIAHEHEAQLSSEPKWVALDEVSARLPDLHAAPVARLKREARMLRVEEVARRCDLNVKTVYGMIERGELASRRFGRVLRVPRAVVESFESQASVAPGRK
jgi:excisionase family DNA binding protein